MQHESLGNISHHSSGLICILEHVSQTVNVMYGSLSGPERRVLVSSSEVSAGWGLSGLHRSPSATAPRRTNELVPFKLTDRTPAGSQFKTRVLEVRI